MALSWLSVDANNGSVIAELPTLHADGALKATLMRYETATANLPMDKAPSNWRQATRQAATFLVALDEREQPLWGGMVTRRTRSARSGGGGVAMTLVSAEGYLDRVYVAEDETFSAWPQNNIVEYLVNKYAKTGTKRGLPIRVVKVGGNGNAMDREYKESEDKTLYTILTDLSGVIGGPEWTMGWEWVDERTLGLVFCVGDRIGSPAPAYLNPAAQFYLPGPVTDAELVEGFGADEGANDVMAVSTGTEGARPQSPHQTVTNDLRPRFEKRWTPSTSITDVGTLTGHAQRELAAMKDGTLALSITANRQEAPALNRDWRLGDDIGFDITAPEFPDGLVGTARCVGWELTETTITPLIDVTDIEGI